MPGVETSSVVGKSRLVAGMSASLSLMREARRRAVSRSVAWPMTLCLACVLPLTGCGGSTSNRDPAQEARIVGETNAFCRRLDRRPSAPRSRRQIRESQKRIATLLKELSRTAAYLPAGRDLNEAHAARRALIRGQSKRAAASPVLDTRFMRLQLRIYRDELKLGVACGGEVARAAHQTELAFAGSVAASRTSPVPVPSAVQAHGSDAVRSFKAGEAVFANSGCLACHRIAEDGKTGPGPDLTRVGSRLPAAGIARTLVKPVAPMPSFSRLPRSKSRALVYFLAQLR